jgi:YidC/Oxa1 family membrane protein insertase
MKLRSLSAFLFTLCFLLPVRSALAQAAPVPPAYGVAQRLASEEQAALAQGNTDIAHRRALQAVAKYREVVASKTFGSGPWGAEALYHEGLIQENGLHDNNTAVLTLLQLQNNYRTVAYPDAAQAAASLTSLEVIVDHHNKVTPPGSYLYAIINFFVNLFGGAKFSYSYALAILAISVLVRLALTPISNKQFASMREMQKLQPYVKEVQSKYAKDKEMAGRKVMELYKENGVNPAAGCLPMFFQLPILYLLYYMIRLYQFQFVHGKFLWVGSALSARYPDFIAPNLGQQDIPLLILYALSMYVTQKLTITPSLDPQQAEQQKTMAVMTPFLSTYLFLQWHLPSAFVLYYLIFNILSTAQQKYYMRRRHADIHGEPEVDRLLDSGSGNAIALNGSKAGITTLNGNGSKLNGNGSKPNGNRSNGATPNAKGVIGPSKIHPKKKRR